MDYLEEAKSYVEFEGDDKDILSEQVNAIRPIALALVAIAENLIAFGTGAAIHGRVKVVEEQITEVANKQAKRLDEHASDFANIDRKIDAIKVAEMVNESYAGRIGQIEIRLEKLEGEDVEEAPDAPPRVDEWRQCSDCHGSGRDGSYRCDICGGSGMVEVYVRGKGVGEPEVDEKDIGDIVWPESEAQPALWEKLENANADVGRLKRQLALRDKQVDEAQLYARELEGKISKILDIARDSDEGVVSFLAFKDDIIRATY